MKNLIILLAIILMVFLFSCDQVIGVKGIILDKETKQPISNVYVYDALENGQSNHYCYSGEDGRFDLSYITGLFFDEYLEVSFNKEGYKFIKLKIPLNDEQNTIFLDKE